MTLMTEREAAARLQVSPKTLEQWRLTGSQDLPFLKIGRLVRYDAHDVAQWIESRRRRSTSDRGQGAA